MRQRLLLLALISSTAALTSGGRRKRRPADAGPVEASPEVSCHEWPRAAGLRRVDLHVLPEPPRVLGGGRLGATCVELDRPLDRIVDHYQQQLTSWERRDLADGSVMWAGGRRLVHIGLDEGAEVAVVTRSMAA